MDLTTRQSARNNGAKQYFTGKPCRRDSHISSRFTSNGKCVECSRLDSLARSRSNPQRNRERVKAWQKANPEKHAAKTTAHFRKKKYGLEAVELNEMFRQQEGKCAICKEPFPKTPNVDQCHVNHHVRGLLCNLCNQGLGLFKDNIDRLQSAADYLKLTMPS